MKRTVKAIFNGLLIWLFIILAFAFYSTAFAQSVTVNVGDIYEFPCVGNDPDESIYIAELLVNPIEENFGENLEGRCVPGSTFFEQPSSAYFGYRVEGENNVNKFIFTEPGVFYGYEFDVSGNNVTQTFTITVNEQNTSSGFGSFLGTTTPLSIIGDVTGGVQASSADILPVVGVVGVPLAFTIGGYLLWFIRRSTV